MYRLILILILIVGNSSEWMRISATVKSFSTADGMSHDRIVGLCQDDRGVVWICTWYGIDRYDGYGFKSFHPQGKQDTYSRFKKAFFRNDSIFVSTVNGRNLVFSLASLTYGTYDGPLPDKNQRCSVNLIDSDGNEWDATYEGVTLTKRVSDNYHLLTNPVYPFVRALYEDSQGRLWVAWCGNPDAGMSDGEVIVYDSNGHPTGLKFEGKVVYSINEDKDHNVWLGTRQNGLSILRPSGGNEFTVYDYYHDDNPNSLSCNRIFDILQDSYGRIWIATLGGGVNLVEKGYDVADLSFSVPEEYPLATNPRVRSIEECEGLLLIATDNGLIKTKLKSMGDNHRWIFQPVTMEVDADGPAEELIHIIKTERGKILISSFGRGIWEYQIDKSAFRHVAADDIAYKQPVFSALPQGKDSLWVVSRSNLLLYDKSGKNFITPVNHAYTMLETKPLKDSSGRNWFATNDGLLCIENPLETSRIDEGRIPVVIFTELVHDQTESSRSLSYADSIVTIIPSQRNSTLLFSSLDYGNSDRIRYYWRIVEKDTTWRETSHGHSLSLAEIPPGKWTMEIRSTDASGQLLDNSGRLHLDFEAYWYERQAVRVAIYALIGLFVLFVLWLLIKYRRLQTIYSKLLDSQPVAVVSAAMTEIKDTEELTDADREFIDTINMKLESGLSDTDFSIDDLVGSLGMSRSVFYRKLKSIVGQSPSEYINQYRLQRAAAMLRADDSKAISTVAYECGFSSPQYFSNLFRKRYQMTPNEWRKNGR